MSRKNIGKPNQMAVPSLKLPLLSPVHIDTRCFFSLNKPKFEPEIFPWQTLKPNDPGTR